MTIKNKYASLIFKVLGLLFCIAGQFLALDILNGNFKIDQFLFYTNQSNILCLVYFAFATRYVYQSIKTDGPQGHATFAPRAKGAVVMAITVTMLIYWFMLDGQLSALDTENTGFFSNTWPLTNYIVHLIVPLFMIFDWILFDEKGNYQILDPIRWLYIPLFYYVFAILVAQTGYRYFDESRYPYFFIDTDLNGIFGVFKYIVVLIIGFVILGYIIYGLDQLLKKLSKKAA